MRLRDKPVRVTRSAPTARTTRSSKPELARTLMNEGAPLTAPGTARAVADDAGRAVAKAVTAVRGLTKAIGKGFDDRLTARFHSVASALVQVRPHVLPGQPSDRRESLASALDDLRGALLGAGQHEADAALSEAIDALVVAYSGRAYDLGVAAIGLGKSGDASRFLDAQAALDDVPEGASAIPGAPVVKLADGSTFVPGQARQYKLTEAAIQKIVGDIDLPGGLVAFVGKDPDDAVPYVQIGVIGPDNYPHGKRDTNPDKLVYGRRWRVEPSLPDYEVVQTVFAAARDARDHEIREMFVVQGKTPFSGHIDAIALDVIEKTGTVEKPANPPIATIDDLTALLAQCSYGGEKLVALELEKRPRTGRLDVVFEIGSTVYEARAEGSNTSDVLHGIMDELRRAAVRDLEETFAYDGEKRFTRDKDPQFLGLVSALTRNPKYLLGGPIDAQGVGHILALEQKRSPTIGEGAATDKAIAAIRSHGPLVGIPPKI